MSSPTTRTGYDVRESADYVNECCLVEITLQEDQMFPRCPRCLELCIWEMFRTPSQIAA
jgi:hypothetical protein